MRKTLNFMSAASATRTFATVRLFALVLLLVAPSANALAQTNAGAAHSGSTSSNGSTDAARTVTPASREASDLQRLVTEFETANGLKVLVKRREGSQSVVTGLFFRGALKAADRRNPRAGRHPAAAAVPDRRPAR